jgi:tRNA A-37 threonylcarbamoyl transferase component Bud32
MSKHAQFFSRRNRVILHKNDHEFTVEKIFEEDESYIIERDFYLSFQSENQLNIPRLLAYDDQKKILILEHIDGDLMTDILQDCEEKNDIEKACKWLNRTIEWLSRFHDLPKVIENKWVIHDINLRNFIVSDHQIYGFDFEQLREGTKERDLIRLIAMYLHEDPVESEFKYKVIDNLKYGLIKTLGMDQEAYDHIISSEIEILLCRRGKKRRIE